MIKRLRADVSNRQEMAYESKGQLPVVVRGRESLPHGEGA